MDGGKKKMKLEVEDNYVVQISLDSRKYDDVWLLLGDSR